jgi:hypothetical protein
MQSGNTEALLINFNRTTSRPPSQSLVSLRQCPLLSPTCSIALLRFLPEVVVVVVLLRRLDEGILLLLQVGLKVLNPNFRLDEGLHLLLLVRNPILRRG